MEPTVFEMLALEYAIESYNDFEHYGFPYEGGEKDQPYVWKMAVDCIKYALSAASTEARADARAESSDDALVKHRAQLRIEARAEPPRVHD